MLSEAVVFGIASGLLMGGSLSRFFSVSFRKLPLIFAAAAMEIAMSTPLGLVVADVGAWALVSANVIKTALLMLFVISNISKPSLWLIGIGGVMNSLPVILNSGKMPISPEILQIAPDSTYTLSLLSGRVASYALAAASTRLLFLSDIILFRGFTLYMVSAGDIVSSAGIAILIITLMLPER